MLIDIPSLMAWAVLSPISQSQGMKRRRNCLRMLLLQWQGNWVELKWLDCVCGSWFMDDAVVPNEFEFSCHMSGAIHVMLLQTMRHNLEHGVLVNWTAWLPSTYWKSLVQRFIHGFMLCKGFDAMESLGATFVVFWWEWFKLKRWVLAV